MDCGQCGFENEAGSRFCGSCGAPQATACGSCQATLKPGLKFCTQCGTPVGEAPSASPPPDALVAQRKTITVVFGDVGGSTGLGERLDPEAAREVMNRYHLDVLEVIGEHGGTVDKFNGDGFMATFGIPEVAEDDASRAVQAAVEIQERFTPFAEGVRERHGGDPITLRVGVNTGEIVIAEGDPDIIGDALNVAARLERACPSGGVLVGPETWRLTRGPWSYEPQGEVTVAGRVEPVEVFLVQGAEAEAPETGTPFVGRDDEFAVIGAQRDQAVETRSLRFVNVIGSPGLGKSRLAREAAIGLDFDHRYSVACERAGSSTFAPVIDLVRSVAGAGPTESPASVMAALRERFSGVDFADGEAERLHDAVSGLVGAGPIRSTEESFWSVRRLIELVGREGPTLLVVDDIQWAEPVLLDLLEHLAEWVTDAAVVLLCLSRPEIRDLRPSLTEAGRRTDAVIALEGLDAEATAALAQRMLGEGELPRALIDRIPTSTEGNPLFVRELVKMLVDDGVIERRGADWQLTIDAEAVEVPPTIASLLAARIDRLDDSDRIVLERAAVIGPEFTDGALRAIVGRDVAALSTVLERLRRMELVEPTGSYWGDHAIHRFHHVLIRDAAYRRLLKGARADLHQQVATWLERASEGLPGDHDEAIALHEEQAFHYRSELGPLDEQSVDVGRSASARLARAAGRALARDDLSAAGPLANRALACLPADDGRRGELLLVACEALLGSGDVVAGEAAVDEFDAIAADDRLRAWAVCFRAQLTAMTEPDRLPEAEQEATSAATILEALRDDAGAAKGHLTRARILVLLGRVGEAETELDLALTAAREADDARRITAVLGNAPLAALWGPSPVPRAGGRCLDIVRLLRITTRAPAVEATSMRCQALLEALRGRFDTARTMLDRCRRKVDELGLRLGSLEAELFAGQIEFLAGDLDAAEAALRTASTGLTAMRLGAEAGQATALLARVLVAKGEVDEAEVLVGTAEQMAGRNLKSAVAWRLARAQVLLAQRDTGTAVGVAQAAVEVVADTDLIVDQADAELVLAEALRAVGDEPAAALAEERARSLAGAKGATALIGDVTDHGAAPANTAATPVPRPGRKSTVPGGVEPRRDLDGRRRSSVEPWDPEATTIVRNLRAAERASNDDDLDALEATMTESLVWVDHRPAVAGTFGREEMVASLDISQTLTFRVIACASDRVVLAHYSTTAQDFEIDFLNVFAGTTEGPGASIDTFDLDQLDEAIDCYHARLAEDAERHGEELVANDASRTLDRGLAHFAFEDFECVDQILSEEFEQVDHRPGLGGRIAGRSAFRSNLEVMFRGGSVMTGPARRISRDRLALLTVRTAAAGFAVDMHVIVESDSSGRLHLDRLYELDQWDEAVAEFERRAAAVDSPGIAPWDPEATTILRMLRRSEALVGAGEGVAAMVVDDLVYVDHRPMFAGEYSRDQFLEGFGMTEGLRIKPLVCGTDRVSVDLHSFEVDGFSIEIVNVCAVTPDGQMWITENYEPDQLDEAVDRYHGLVREDAQRFGSEVIENAASRAIDRFRAHLNLGDLDRTMALTAADFVEDDRRPITGSRMEGRDRLRDQWEVSTAGTALSTPVRIDGERLSMTKARYALDDFTVDLLSISDVDETGRRVWAGVFDLDQWDEAVAEFERRAAFQSSAVEPWNPEATTVMRSFRTWERLTNDGEHHRHPQLYPDDMVWVDHRPFFAGTYGSEENYQALRPLQRCRVRPILVTIDRVALAHAILETQEFTSEVLQIIQVDRDGVAFCQHTFDVDQLDEAVATYHELVVDNAERFGGDVVANDASQLADRLSAWLGLGVVDGLRSYYSPTYRQIDHRVWTGGQHIDGWESQRENLAFMFEHPASFCGPTLRTAGDRLALQQFRWSSDDNVVDILFVQEVGDDGLLREHAVYDLDQYAEAVAEFERRAAAVEATGESSIERLCRRHADAVMAGDGAAQRAMCRDDMRYVDHRPMFAGAWGPDDLVASTAPVEHMTFRTLRSDDDRSGAVLYTCVTKDFTIEIVNVITTTPDDRFATLDTFDIDDLDAAMARYDEIVGAG